MFRRFFGFPDRGVPDGPQDFWEDENFDRTDGFDPFQSLFTEPNEMFRHFERHFEDIFKSFGFMDFNGPSFDNYGSELKPDIEPNVPIRDRMLKQPNEKPLTPSDEQIRTHPWSRFWSKPNIEDRSNFKDTDLDVDVSQRGLGNVLTNRNAEPTIDRPQIGRSFFRSTTMTKIRGADGKVEERCTKSDGYGNKETIVTRKVGDRSHSIITRKDKTGTQEHEENFVNMDEKNLEDFDREWSTPSSSSKQLKDSRENLPQLYGGDETAPKLFSKLFEKFLPLKKPDI